MLNISRDGFILFYILCLIILFCFCSTKNGTIDGEEVLWKSVIKLSFIGRLSHTLFTLVF